MVQQLRIAVIGGESTGKSTLARGLAELTHGLVVTEVLRSFVEEHGRTPVQSEQRSILVAQHAREISAAQEFPHAVILCDPATTMTAIYSELYFQDSSLRDEALQYTAEYDALLWCRPDIPWVDDAGQHDGPQFREAADQIIEQWFTELCAITTVIQITGEQSRIAQAHGLLTEEFGRVWQHSGTDLST